MTSQLEDSCRLGSQTPTSFDERSPSLENSRGSFAEDGEDLLGSDDHEHPEFEEQEEMGENADDDGDESDLDVVSSFFRFKPATLSSNPAASRSNLALSSISTELSPWILHPESLTFLKPIGYGLAYSSFSSSSFFLSLNCVGCVFCLIFCLFFPCFSAGAFSSVFLGTHQNDICAIKKLNIVVNPDAQQSQVDLLEKEAHLLRLAPAFFFFFFFCDLKVLG